MLIFAGLVSQFRYLLSFMASLALFFVGFLVLTGGVIALQRDHSDENDIIMVMDEEELLGLFDVMGSLLDDPAWAKQHPLPCTDTPWPGVECEIAVDLPTFHVTKVHVGPDVLDPPCKTSANLSDSLLKLPYLKTLSIFNCFVSTSVNLSPTVFGAFSSLEHLALVSNPALSGEIPPSLAKIPSLRVLSLSQNSLQGKIPRELGRLVSLQQLDLSYNNLSGEIPEEIGGLKSLSILDLSWNSLEGQVHCSLGMLQLLQKIDLGSNKLNGSLPPALGKLKSLVLLDLSHNFINGPIPETLSGLDTLQYLIVDHNPLHSTLPLFVGTLKSLTSISFSGCGFNGKIPSFISSLNTLTALSLDNNNLSGPVPSSLGSLPSLDQLNLSHNQLSGELKLPEEFIDRLGKRLDVKANPGLCTSDTQKLYMKKNISMYLEIPPCLGKQIGDDNKTFQNHRPNDPNDDKTSSNAQSQWLLNQNQRLLSTSLVFCCVIILL